MFRPRVRFRPKKINHHQSSPTILSPPLFPHTILTATLRAARDGTLSSVEWRYRSTVALAASTAAGASEPMPTTSASASAASGTANRDDETILFFRGLLSCFNSPENFQSNEYAKQRRESEINPAAASKNEIRRAEEGGGEEKRRWKARASERERAEENSEEKKGLGFFLLCLFFPLEDQLSPRRLPPTCNRRERAFFPISNE